MDSYNNSQLKLLYTMEYFVMHTDKEHPANANDIVKHFEKLGIKAERKAIYRNIDILNKFGIHINKSKNAFYYVPSETDLLHVFAEENCIFTYIPGAVKKNGGWFIPRNAAYPKDEQKK